MVKAARLVARMDTPWRLFIKHHMCFIKHFLDDKAESKKAAKSEQTVQDAPQQSEAVQPQEVAQASTGQMKRQSDRQPDCLESAPATQLLVLLNMCIYAVV